ncbi:ABC-three component system middle component 1 [Exiguobacterium sp. s191]|uniref:ABC-three component system middle component 1 n=1 Tax=Exiguobacterium sp. s191 TaxID=2751196 RepID=UPI001BEA0994|nr:ABC-three component system middle component 1 [Exiguobacterium sp. s191]
MKVETLIDLLQSKKFTHYKFEEKVMNQLEQQNIDVWANDKRMIMLKEYRTQTSILEWDINDQAHIASILHKIPNEYLNNLYFFMVLDFNTADTELRLKINKIEKSEIICKKYIIKEEEDFNRIPFLISSSIEINNFDFDEKFKEKIKGFSDSPNKRVNLNLENIINDYFNRYLLDKKSPKIKKESLLELGE